MLKFLGGNLMLTGIKFDVEETSSVNEKTKERAIKYGIMLLYSHWEGAIKKLRSTI